MNMRQMPSDPMCFPISTSVTFEGKAYGLCSEGQMNYLMRSAREKILSDAMDEERVLTDEEMAAVQGMNLAQWHRELNEIKSEGLDSGARTLSAAPTFAQTSIELAFLAGDDPNPFDLCYRNERLGILDRALSRLQERQRQIVELYHQQGLTMRQVAVLMRLDESRISQLHAAALVQLKANVDSLLRPGQAGASETGIQPRAAGVGA